MKIRLAQDNDLPQLSQYDKHISKSEMETRLNLKRVYIAEVNHQLAGWLRWGLFWDNISFMNMLYFLEEYRFHGYGKELVLFWEAEMRSQGYKMVMTSSQSDETAQHFYRKLKYVDRGSLLLKDEPLEIIFTKDLDK